MAKYERIVEGSFDSILETLENAVLHGSVSASYEDGSDCRMGAMRCAVRVYERYSALGSNRVSMAVTLVGNGQNLFLSAITSGGSQAMLFKINTWGEGSFLDTLVEVVERLKQG